MFTERGLSALETAFAAISGVERRLVRLVGRDRPDELPELLVQVIRKY
jgi:hypothetical protein